MQVTVVGTGYVGLVTGACLAHVGHQVICLDIDREKIAALQAGRVPIYEDGLAELLAAQQERGRICFTSEYAEAIPPAGAVFICVGTPSLPDGQADMSGVQAAATEIGRHLEGGYKVIVNKSTVPIGSGDWVGVLVRNGLRQRAPVPQLAQPVAAAVGGVGGLGLPAFVDGREPEFDVVSNPEFLREGTAVLDALYPDRIVVGSSSERAIEAMQLLYRPLLERSFPPIGGDPPERPVPFLVTDRTSAEMIKYAANAFLATKISFINEVGNICERVGADVQQVARGIGLDARIGQSFLAAGIGWGGSCFPKDLASLCHTAREYGYECRLLEAACQVNAEQRLLVVRKLQERLKVMKGKTVTLWGLAFKPGTDDVRDAPAAGIATRLLELGARVQAYDPVATPNARRWDLAIEYYDSPYAAAAESDAVAVITEWPEFAELDWSALKARMNRPLILDGRNFLPKADLLRLGFEYCAIGR